MPLNANTRIAVDGAFYKLVESLPVVIVTPCCSCFSIAMPKRRGRKQLSPEKRQQIMDLARGAGHDRSLRWIAQKVGVADLTASRILDQEGIRPKRTVRQRSSQKANPLRKPAITLADVAQAAGLSTSTVSLALRGSPKIAQQTVTIVKGLADKLGYRVHPYVGAHMAAIRRGRITQIRASLAYLYDRRRSWEEASKLVHGPQRQFGPAKETAHRLGYQLEPFIYRSPSTTPAQLRKILYARGIEGLILDLALDKKEDLMDLSGFSYVSLAEIHVPALIISHDGYFNMELMFTRLWRDGYRRVGYISNQGLDRMQHFAPEAAYHQCQQRLLPSQDHIPSLPLDTLQVILKRSRPWVREVENAERYRQHIPKGLTCRNAKKMSSDQLSLSLLKTWLKRHRPDVVIMQSDQIIRLLEELGYRIPQDIGVAHPDLNAGVAGWSGLRPATERIGQSAVRQLVSLINHGERGIPDHNSHLLHAGEWVSGWTTQKQKAASPLTDDAEDFLQLILSRQHPQPV